VTLTSRCGDVLVVTIRCRNFLNSWGALRSAFASVCAQIFVLGSLSFPSSERERLSQVRTLTVLAFARSTGAKSREAVPH
jgi:hypothetical protein